MSLSENGKRKTYLRILYQFYSMFYKRKGGKGEGRQGKDFQN